MKQQEPSVIVVSCGVNEIIGDKDPNNPESSVAFFIDNFDKVEFEGSLMF